MKREPKPGDVRFELRTQVVMLQYSEPKDDFRTSPKVNVTTLADSATELDQNSLKKALAEFHKAVFTCERVDELEVKLENLKAELRSKGSSPSTTQRYSHIGGVSENFHPEDH